MSFGTIIESEILKQVIKDADDAGILMVAAAGNQGESEQGSTVEYPAAYDEVIAVGAINSEGRISDISSVGEEIDLFAPGETIPATGYFGEVIETSGTSMAAPHVTGVASVLWGKDRSKSSDFIKTLLCSSAKNVEQLEEYGKGIVDLHYALSMYDAFDEEYVENGDGNDEIVALNIEPFEAYSDAELSACWNTTDHMNAVGEYNNTQDSYMEIFKIGAKIPDTYASDGTWYENRIND